MKEKAVHTAVAMLVLVFLLMPMLCGCGKKEKAAETPDPIVTPIPAGEARPSRPSGEASGPAGTPAAEAGQADIPGAGAGQAEVPGAEAPEAGPGSGRQDGERFEETIILEGMEETVRYEHIRNTSIGIEMDYDYESFVRRTGSDRECFISVWDDPEDPENYLEVTYSPKDAETAAAAIGETLSNDYDIIRETYMLDRAGSCTRIDASNAKGNGGTPEHLQAVYIIPAPDGCRVATAHYSFESAEGFGRRFSYIVKTLQVIDRAGESRISDEEALSAVRSYCFASEPGLEELAKNSEYPIYWDIFSSGENEVVIVFRSYTGAQNRYYIDRTTGETYVTEFIPGVSSEEKRTGESFNAKEYRPE